MHVLRDAESVQVFLASTPDPELHRLMADRLADLSDYDDMDLGDLVNFIVMETNDPLPALDEALGFAVLSNRFDLTPYGAPEFTPSWDSLTEHPDWFELVYVISDDGFGLVVLIPKQSGIDASLLAMCSRYVSPHQELS